MLVGQPYILGVPPFVSNSNASLINAQQNKLLNMDAFLKMFTTQLQHQDPMNPMESYEMAAQLAQFSTVEQLIKGNEYLKEGTQYLSSINNLQIVSLIGKDVEGYTDLITVKDGVPSELKYTLQDKGMVTIYIYDESGKLVRSMDKGKLEAGSYGVEWDGLDNLGNKVKDGDYRIEIEVISEKGQKEVIYPDAKGSVEAVKFIGGLPYLVLDSEIKMPAGFIIEIRGEDNEREGSSTQSGHNENNLMV